MSGETVVLAFIVGIFSLVMWLRTSGPLTILALMSSWLVAASLGADIIAWWGGIFESAQLKFALYLVLASLPAIVVAAHFRGAANGGFFERFATAFMLATLCVVIIGNLRELSGLQQVVFGSYFANILLEYESIIVTFALGAALFEVLNKNATLGIAARKNRSKK